ncbi:hypothetical protein AVEN_114354-1 [Araneus ventricosus]|uniref:Uncharacterized protein n=1 Tax=Araneus ventricosus TaxID=182803 RepID=A0A4Y2F2X3_ARAVE|nr:hypothetical protein AVEN_114354-1 [Araneus ventricosus]
MTHFTLSQNSFHITYFSNPEDLALCITHFNKPAELVSCIYSLQQRNRSSPLITNSSNKAELTPCITHYHDSKCSLSIFHSTQSTTKNFNIVLAGHSSLLFLTALFLNITH